MKKNRTGISSGHSCSPEDTDFDLNDSNTFPPAPLKGESLRFALHSCEFLRKDEFGSLGSELQPPRFQTVGPLFNPTSRLDAEPTEGNEPRRGIYRNQNVPEDPPPNTNTNTQNALLRGDKYTTVNHNLSLSTWLTGKIHLSSRKKTLILADIKT